MKDPFKAFTDEFSKQKQSDKDSKIFVLDDQRDVFDLLPSPLEIETLEGFHPLFADCALVMTLVMPLSYIALASEGFDKHRKTIDQAEDKYQPDNPSSPVFESYFTMWSLFDLEVEKTGKVLADVVDPLKTLLKIHKDKMGLIERLKMSYPGVYLCEATGSICTLKEITSGKSIQAILEPGCEEAIEKNDILLLRLLQNIEDEIYVQLSSPYIIKSTENDWIDFFAKHDIHQGKSFDCEAYRTFMKKGNTPDFWLNYIHNSCLSVNDMVVTLEGPPLPLAASP